MKILELFAGSRSIWNEADKMWFKTFSTDLTWYNKIDYQVNILKFDTEKVPFIPDMIWASPPCTTFSVASMGHHRTWWVWQYKPATPECKIWLRILKKTIKLIAYYQKLNPDMIFYVENPTWMMRKMIEDIFNEYWLMRKREVVWYCKYWFNIAKSTDIWTNNKNFFWKKCKNHTYDKEWNQTSTHCHHESARRWSRTWTQWRKNAHERSKIPSELCISILKAIK